jgi:hypothetical protein
MLVTLLYSVTVTVILPTNSAEHQAFKTHRSNAHLIMLSAHFGAVFLMYQRWIKWAILALPDFEYAEGGVNEQN